LLVAIRSYNLPFVPAGCYHQVPSEPIPLYAENIYKLGIQAPQVDKLETTHFILSVTDKGIPALTRYKRVIVNIEP
jgi:hypothetical protein